MTDTDNIQTKGFPKLDGTPVCPRQKAEGKYRYVHEIGPDGFKWTYELNMATGTYRITNSDHELLQHQAQQDERLRLRAEEHRNRLKTTNQYQLGAREFTLTYSPKWFDDLEARLRMSKAIDKLMKYYKDEIIDLRAIGEVGTNGLSHIHCFYKLRGGLKITDKNFKRAWPHWNPKKTLGWGFEGGHHAPVKSESDFLGYIEKDLETSWYDKLAAPTAADPQTISK